MAIKAAKDQFANIAVISCTESAADTLTYKKLETGIAMFEKVAWVISRIEYFMHNLDVTLHNATGDLTMVALTVSNALTTLGSGNIEINPMVLHGVQFKRMDLGASATGVEQIMPVVYDFSALPGGGIIVPPTALFLAVQGSSEASAAIVFARIYYTVLQLKPEDYWELVEARRIIAS